MLNLLVGRLLPFGNLELLNCLLGVHVGVDAIQQLAAKDGEVFAGGFRNPYGFTFNASGELFTHESDMEWDIGLPWYRPTRVLHVVPGGEYGWRSGWGVWPSYFFDSVPAVLEKMIKAGMLGRKSGRGFYVYNHGSEKPNEAANRWRESGSASIMERPLRPLL